MFDILEVHTLVVEDVTVDAAAGASSNRPVSVGDF